MKAKRIYEIESFIKENKTASIEELRQRFNVSINTIRRDVNQLVDMNIVKKVYGGIEVIEDSHKAVDYNQRNIENSNSKKLIGELAANEIEANDIIYIDTGTTTIHLLDYVDKHLTFTIITNSLDIMNKASQFDNVTLFIIGEKYKPITRSFIGIDSNMLLEKFNINKAFMSATGVNIQNGLSNSEMEENLIKQYITSKATETFILADHSKMGKSTLLTYCDLSDINKMFTDKIPPKNINDFCQEYHIAVYF
ncbi:DeoR/GlpR family DNA-binding transcription regulator [Staphylococcus pseudoxylosus]|nr:DeoR/GlpR family DNA-binding transcription regulator [Staphylococcus pseudoxylosus]CCM44130.1 transcriptional repressor of the myo-inositol catabolic operon DeoR family [Staphylococcus xylosus]MBM2659143.1 DeoR/GlpR transcriptional regulator [Staphylococcus pseudoxylosus]MCE5002447.1 DeoR/GlpR transcriptional regulator [Staphylococcus pseudoxylosus]MDW8545491.1 DeoR/GlpR family DNA-binding transcription regulator [Staphylococcus pseudoxylosus]MEB5781848.1 DeoR/GlpR family DNA-binding transc